MNGDPRHHGESEKSSDRGLSRLAEFLEAPDGSFSATRLAFLAWALGVLVVWISVSFARNSLQPINPSVTYVLGILMTGKVIQRFREK